MKHGHSIGGKLSPEYAAWRSIKQRTLNPDCPQYQNYGARGISVCREWVESFEQFLFDMGRRPSPRHSVDRINNEGHYEPSNCRWATKTEQNRNTRKNQFLTVRGETRCKAEWARLVGIPRAKLQYRLNAGWSPERALGLIKPKEDASEEEADQPDMQAAAGGGLHPAE